jgi:hypothetical protein
MMRTPEESQKAVVVRSAITTLTPGATVWRNRPATAPALLISN